MGYIEAVSAKGWRMYDITEEKRMDDWESREARGPAEAVELNHGYVLLPEPKTGQSLTQAYGEVYGVGPCLRNPDPKECYVELWYSPRLALFSRMVVRSAGVILHTPNPTLRYTDKIVLPGDRAEEIFVRDFDIVTMEEITQAVLDHQKDS